MAVWIEGVAVLRRDLAAVHDGILQIVAGAEMIALAGDHDDTDLRHVDGVLQRMVQLVEQIDILSIAALWPRKRDPRNAAE